MKVTNDSGLTGEVLDYSRDKSGLHCVIVDNNGDMDLWYCKGLKIVKEKNDTGVSDFPESFSDFIALHGCTLPKWLDEMKYGDILENYESFYEFMLIIMKGEYK